MTSRNIEGPAVDLREFDEFVYRGLVRDGAGATFAITLTSFPKATGKYDLFIEVYTPTDMVSKGDANATPDVRPYDFGQCVKVKATSFEIE